MARMVRQLGIFIAAAWLLLGASSAFAGLTATLTFTKAFGASSIAVNGSTSLTFTLTGGGAAATGAFGFTDTLPAGLVVSTPNGLSSIACTGGSTPGTATATAGTGSISLAGMNLNNGTNCVFSVNVTATTVGTKSNVVTTTVPLNVGMAATANATLSVTAAAATPTPTPAPPIPNHEPATPTTGIGTQPTTVDLSQGQGPTMTTCMLNTVKGLAGFSQAVYLGQDTYGVASIDLKDGRYLSFYPLSANTDTSRTPGLYFSSSNRASLATSCGSFDIVPAVYNMAKLGSILAAGQSTDARVSFGADGVATYVKDGVTYVVRPDFFVARGANGTAGLTLTADGYSFNDGAGSVQLLRGAFSDADALRTAIASAGGVGTLFGQADGTYIFTFSDGRRYSLRADVQLLPAGSINSSALLVEGPGYFYYRGSNLLMWQRMTYTLLN